MKQILIVEDEAIIRTALRRLLERHGHSVSEAGSVGEAVANFTLGDFQLIIADLRLPGAPGTDIIDRCGEVPVLIMTSYASVRSAVDSMKMGAVDYIAKPFDHDDMVMTVQRILKQRNLALHNEVLKSELSRAYPIEGIIGTCPAMQEVFARIQKVAPADTTVLILGESGTGKELVARAVHEHSARRNAPIITVNCAAIPEGLIESELFGHEKGAFTGAVESHRGLVEAADGGTLFLDEIGELPLEAQARLLRVLQEGEIRRVGSTQSRKANIRLVAATHRNLQKRVNDGRFRNDLYFRLHVMEIALPPLRDRGDDIEELARVLLDKTCHRLNRPPMQISAEAVERIRRYPWPGNVRELENVLERAVILSEGDTVSADLLPLECAATTVPTEAAPPDNLSLDEYFVRFVREHEMQMTETELAKQLGVSRKTLWERRQKLGIPRKRSPVS
ncbi:sigma-54-dependent transcriptional regulator [Thiohalomonas denitrificans]|uniref:Two-component response regulator CbrB n=1 Tax=Thiohalomonas denitrificans TaxID=415747 RepID=A0A1G5PJY7_9GAMM|nr:sigma-54 dependent transcriptional regulator [Thiohalomonas denitrificans]SCZ49359.1 Two-component response regulator CbrB [Thiohalomonas denitrificans]